MSWILEILALLIEKNGQPEVQARHSDRMVKS